MNEQGRLSFDAPGDDPVSIYFASGLTGLNDDQRSIVELVSGLLSEFCGDSGIRVHQPIMHTDPRRNPEYLPTEIRRIDHSKVASSDGLIVLADFASWGGGVEITWAERLRLPMLLLHREEIQVSRLVLGSTADLQVQEWRNHKDLQAAWQSFFLGRKGQIETHRRLRADREMLWGPVVARFADSFLGLTTAERTEVSATAQISQVRIEEMLASAMFWAEASMDEVQALAGALGIPSSSYVAGEGMPAFGPQSLIALQHAAAAEGWSGDRAVELLRRAEVELARGGTRRLRFVDPRDWIDFATDDH